jgi:hypothetical protein
MNEPIKIQGRYGKHSIIATKVSDGVYNLRMVEDFYRCGGFSEDARGVEGLSFIDPSGGPFIAHGSIAQQYHPDLPPIKIKKLEEQDGKIFMYLDTIDDDLDEPLGQACRLEDPECESCQ